MKVLIYSDLHNEFDRFSPPPVDVDLVVLAGDIDVLARGVGWANETFKSEVIYCGGNHEYYKGHIDRTFEKMKAAAASHVHVLENEVFIAGDVRFLVATAWTDFASTGDVVAASNVCARDMNDFRQIRAGSGYRRLRPVDIIERNHATKAFFTQELAKPFDGKTVVVSHHCPLREAAGDEYDGHISAAYYNNWHSLVDQADAWIFGHTHKSIDAAFGNCRVISNPRGYPGEETGFEPTKILEV
ncbi:metallophosphoesterase [Pseudomonas caspiana]|uniref:Serine/threonine protein phosphatase n=1 Tax=Pseudomonas caspiana TaxID=1451454 RepID=A0A1Y3P7N9_9PSED|nr:metallophosphoesterase [Pseudomonas caspiana]OUM75828.1 serine/threonine protein phosphatase [Pseudomonas caspiana]